MWLAWNWDRNITRITRAWEWHGVREARAARGADRALPHAGQQRAADARQRPQDDGGGQDADFPQGLDYTVALDTTLAVSAGIDEIYKTLGEALVLVIFVVYIFLQGWRATLIPLLAVPVSLIGTFVVFPMLGFSINTLSLFGLGAWPLDWSSTMPSSWWRPWNTISSRGMTPHDAAVKAMEEVSGPVIAIALILAAVFIPTAFVPGITGQLYKQFAVTIAISVLFSAFNALTLSPALSAMLLRPKKEARGPLGAFFRWFNSVFGRATDGYVNVCST